MEGKKFMLMPFHTRWYQSIIKNELKEIERVTPTMLTEIAERNIDLAKEQLEYY